MKIEKWDLVYAIATKLEEDDVLREYIQARQIIKNTDKENKKIMSGTYFQKGTYILKKQIKLKFVKLLEI